MSAIDKNFKVYKSSAGSGKTFTLVKEFLRLCLIGTDLYGFSRILAITFTNKATYEMKHRILSALKDLSSGAVDGDEYKKILTVQSGLTSEEVKLRSGQILTAILHSYADFGISTIDKFTHRLIRTFSKDLGLPPNFKVELDEQKVLREVIDILIDTIGRDERVTELILRFTFSRIEEERSWKIDTELIEFAKDTLREKSKPYLNELRGLTEEDYNNTLVSFSKFINTFETKLKGLGEEAIALMKVNSIDPKSFAGRAKISVYFRRIADLKLEFIVPNPEILKNVENGNWAMKKVDSAELMAIERIQQRLEVIFNEISTIAEEQYSKYISALAVVKNLHSLSLLNYIEQKLDEFKKEERLIQISDFNELISSVVENESMPFIYERLGDKYKHVMIDEFQDTSVKQFSNLLPLVEDSLARGNENLIVGDAKQAIYRFRGGEVGQFSDMPNYKLDVIEQNDLYDERMTTLGIQYNEQTLDTNYRSLQNIVSFNQQFFNFAIALDGLTEKMQNIYEGHGQTALESKPDGYVTIDFIDEKDTEEKKIAYFTKIHSKIDESLNQGFSYRDIAVLVRKNSHAKEIAEYLKSQQIAVLSSDALLLKNDAQVQFLLSLSAWVFMPTIHIYQKEIIQYLVETDVLKGDLHNNLELYINKQSFQTLFEDLNIPLKINELKLKSAHEFYENLVRMFSLDNRYNVYIQFFQDEVLDYFKSNKATVPQFLEWWQENEEKLSISAEAGIDAVNLLTIHKSKGLEFPVVIMPFATQDLKFSSGIIKNFIWTENINTPVNSLPYALVEYKKELESSDFKAAFNSEFEKNQIDLMNDIYVGTTRAIERMHLISERKNSKDKKKRNVNFCDLLDDFVIHSSLDEIQENCFAFGTESRKRGKEKKIVEQALEMTYLSQAWNEKIRIANSARVQWKQNERIQYGILLHELLGEISEPNELEIVIARYLTNGIFEEKDAQFFNKKLGYLFEQPEIVRFFDKKLKIKNEADLLDSEGKLLRPDRVVYFKETIAVVDYKTGEKNEAHHQQVNQYIHALSAIETNKKVEGYILYTETAELEQV